MQTLAGGSKLLAHQQLQPRWALLLLLLSLSANLPVLRGSSEVFKYGDEPEHAGNETGTHWTYGEQQRTAASGGTQTYHRTGPGLACRMQPCSVCLMAVDTQSTYGAPPHVTYSISSMAKGKQQRQQQQLLQVWSTTARINNPSSIGKIRAARFRIKSRIKSQM
jgi:hypothetical protein